MRTNMRHVAMTFVLLGSIVGGMPCAHAQGPPDQKARVAAHRQAMERLAYMDGVWRGPAWMILPTGEKHAITQTERIGPFLDGAVKVIEGRGYEPDGTVGFNALGVVSFDSEKNSYSLRSYAMGMSGDFPLTLTENGYTWEIPAGPATIRYTCVVSDSGWTEVGDRIMPGQEPLRFFEMNLARVGDTSWPAADPVLPK